MNDLNKFLKNCLDYLSKNVPVLSPQVKIMLHATAADLGHMVR